MGFLCLGLLACSARPSEDPQSAVLALFEHLQAGRAEGAWKLLVPEDRERLLDRHRALAEARGERPSDRAEDALNDFGLKLPAAPDQVTLASRPGDIVRVRVTAEAGESATFEVRRDDKGHWRVALLDALEPTPAPSAPRGASNASSKAPPPNGPRPPVHAPAWGSAAPADAARSAPTGGERAAVSRGDGATDERPTDERPTDERPTDERPKVDGPTVDGPQGALFFQAEDPGALLSGSSPSASVSNTAASDASVERGRAR